jgi:hypothetical protein
MYGSQMKIQPRFQENKRENGEKSIGNKTGKAENATLNAAGKGFEIHIEYGEAAFCKVQN